jgi:hypothetical protein
MSIKNKSSIAVDAKREKLETPSEPFQADGKHYRFTLPQFIYNGEVVKAADALKDAVLLAELVEIGATVIEEVEVKEEGGK